MLDHACTGQLCVYASDRHDHAQHPAIQLFWQCYADLPAREQELFQAALLSPAFLKVQVSAPSTPSAGSSAEAVPSSRHRFGPYYYFAVQIRPASQGDLHARGEASSSSSGRDVTRLTVRLFGCLFGCLVVCSFVRLLVDWCGAVRCGVVERVLVRASARARVRACASRGGLSCS